MTQVPDTFFKYCSAQTAKIVLNNGTFRWSSPNRLNDPYELRVRPLFRDKHKRIMSEYVDLILTHVFVGSCIGPNATPKTRLLIDLCTRLKAAGATKDELHREITTDYPMPNASSTKSHWDEWVAGLNPLTVRIFCVSESGSILTMWSHYADSHRGCCFELRHVREADTPLIAATKVKYSREIPDIPLAVNDLVYGPSRETKKQALDCLLYTKGTDWEYEKEWRCITYREEGDKDYSDFQFCADEIKTIVIGNKMDSESEREIREIALRKYPNARVVRAELESDKFAVTW